MYGADCNMSTIVIRSLEPLVSCSPLGAIHILDTVTAVLTLVVSIVQVRLTGVPSYSVVGLEGVMVRVSWGGGTDTKTSTLDKVHNCINYFLSEEHQVLQVKKRSYQTH